MEEGIKSFITEWLTSPLPEIIERDLPLDKDYVITVTGKRRSGKTFLLYQTIKKIIEGGFKMEDIKYHDRSLPLNHYQQIIKNEGL